MLSKSSAASSTRSPSTKLRCNSKLPSDDEENANTPQRSRRTRQITSDVSDDEDVDSIGQKRQKRQQSLDTDEEDTDEGGSTMHFDDDMDGTQRPAAAFPSACSLAFEKQAAAFPSATHGSSHREDKDDDEQTPASDHEGEEDDGVFDVEPRLKDCDRTPESVQRTVNRNGEARIWMVLARRWVSNATALDAGSGVAMYLPVFPTYVAPLALIKRNHVLQELALTRGGDRVYAETCSALFHRHRRKARAQYNRSLCIALFTQNSPHCIAYNVLQGGNGPMTLSPKMEHLGTTEALMELIASDELYTDPALFKIWVAVHASGVIYGAERHRPTERLETFLSVNYDAHARVEVSQRLQFQGFHAGSTPQYLTDQASKFRRIRKLCRTDRLYNMEAVRTPSQCKISSTRHRRKAMAQYEQSLCLAQTPVR